MPRRPTGRRTKRRKTVRRRTRRSRIPLGIQRKATQLARLRYCTGIELSPGTLGTLGYHLFRANSCHDPDHTGTGHQPMSWDEYSELYNHYVVLGSKITVQFTSQAASTLSPPVVGIFISDDTTHSTSGITTLIEQNRCRYRMLAHSYYQKPTTMVSRFSTKKFFNVTDVKDNLDRLGAPIGSNPSEEGYFVVFCGDSNEGEDISGVYGLVTIEYIVAFSEPKELAQS